MELRGTEGSGAAPRQRGGGGGGGGGTDAGTVPPGEAMRKRAVRLVRAPGAGGGRPRHPGGPSIRGHAAARPAEGGEEAAGSPRSPAALLGAVPVLRQLGESRVQQLRGRRGRGKGSSLVSAPLFATLPWGGCPGCMRDPLPRRERLQKEELVEPAAVQRPGSLRGSRHADLAPKEPKSQKCGERRRRARGGERGGRVPKAGGGGERRGGGARGWSGGADLDFGQRAVLPHLVGHLRRLGEELARGTARGGQGGTGGELRPAERSPHPPETLAKKGFAPAGCWARGDRPRHQLCQDPARRFVPWGQGGVHRG